MSIDLKIVISPELCLEALFLPIFAIVAGEIFFLVEFTRYRLSHNCIE